MQETSLAAHDSMRYEFPKIHRRIIAYLSDYPFYGTTCDEAEIELDMSHQTCSAAFTKLKNRGVINDTGKRRRTRSGRPAIVWALSQRDNVGNEIA